jgi:glycine/D-amino acid oxidase-like deaminating enzyme
MGRCAGGATQLDAERRAIDRTAGVYRAGGYVGEGVAAANLAGRCLAHLIAGTGDD